MRITLRTLASSWLMLAVGFVVASQSQARASFIVTTYNSQAAFLAAVSGAVTDTFNDLAVGAIGSPLNRAVGSYVYDASAARGLFASSSAGDVSLSPSSATDTLNFAISSGNVTAVGGYFFDTDSTGNAQLGTISVSINGGQYAQTITTNSPTNFFGWVVNDGTPITDMKFSTLNESGPLSFSTVNNLILAQAVPEPSTYALAAIATGSLGLIARRRKSSKTNNQRNS